MSANPEIEHWSTVGKIKPLRHTELPINGPPGSMTFASRETRRKHSTSRSWSGITLLLRFRVQERCALSILRIIVRPFFQELFLGRCCVPPMFSPKINNVGGYA